MLDFLFFGIRLDFKCKPRAESEGVFEDGCVGEACVLAPAIVKLFEGFFLLVREALFKILMMQGKRLEAFVC